MAGPDFRLLFESAPGLLLVLTPAFRIVAVSNSYLRATHLERSNIIGRDVFDVFPLLASSLRQSLAKVTKSHTPDVMNVESLDAFVASIQREAAPLGQWIAVNSPVLGSDNQTQFIIHQVEDVTDLVRLQRRGTEQKRTSDALRTHAGQMEDELSGQAREMTEANTQHREVEEASRRLTDRLEEQVLEGTQDLSRAEHALSTEVAGRHDLEEQFRQSQKMEAVGQLAGGVAHDFNNLLTVILSFARFVREDLGAAHASCSDVLEIEKSAERAAALTQQLLAFSRKQILDPKILDLNEVIGGAERMLRRLISEDIAFTTVLGQTLGRVRADRGHLEQILMNLIVNARDAMPTGGRVTIETANVELQSDHGTGDLGARTGSYVMISVTDTGTGMDDRTRESIFLPFFTTKGVGKGTGLGLAMVHGVVKQSRGEIIVTSAPGKGSCFKIFLPRYFGADDSTLASAPERVFPKGSATVLVVEDEEAVRLVAKRVLTKAGYNVVIAASPDEALKICSAPLVLDLVLSDVVMPGLDGPSLAKQLKLRSPELKVLFMSGYTNGALVNHGVLDTGIAFLQKPFTPDVLIAKVHDALQMA